MLLGKDSIAVAKVGWGSTLCVLGIEISISEKGFLGRPARDKIVKWLGCISKALDEDYLAPGDASKLGGKLGWGASHLFRKLGRAMLRPIFDQKSRRDGAVSSELRHSLRWWKTVLMMELAELHQWETTDDAIVHLFCDASSTPPHLGAVLFVDGQCLWTHRPLESHVMSFFQSRKDNQIMGLELLGVSLGLSTFAQYVTKRRVVIHCDNSGAEVSACHFQFNMNV